MVPGSQPAPPRLMPRCLAVPQSNTVAEVPWGVLIRGWGAGPALGAHRRSGTDPRNSQRARRVEHEVGTRLKRNVVALLGRKREIFKMGLAVVARIYPDDHARAPSHREIIVQTRCTSDSCRSKPVA